MVVSKLEIHYVYKIHFLCGYPAGRYYIGRHKHTGSLSTDKYAGSGDFCKAYFKKYGKIEGVTYIKEILEINPSMTINKSREAYLIGDKYKTDPLCMNLAPGGTGDNLHTATAKKVVQYSLLGDKIAEYSSQTEAAAAIGLTSGVISACCKNNIQSAAGYYWTFADEELDLRNKRAHSLPIIQYDKFGQEVARFKSIKDAAQTLDIDESVIGACCHRKRYSAGGHLWRFINEPLQKCELKNHKCWGKVKVKQFDMDGNYIQTFDSLRDAARAVGASWQSVQRVCMKKRKSTHNYKWEYA